jgi:hypothetical protein
MVDSSHCDVPDHRCFDSDESIVVKTREAHVSFERREQAEKHEFHLSIFGTYIPNTEATYGTH